MLPLAASCLRSLTTAKAPGAAGEHPRREAGAATLLAVLQDSSAVKSNVVGTIFTLLQGLADVIPMQSVGCLLATLRTHNTVHEAGCRLVGAIAINSGNHDITPSTPAWSLGSPPQLRGPGTMAVVGIVDEAEASCCTAVCEVNSNSLTLNLPEKSKTDLMGGSHCAVGGEA